MSVSLIRKELYGLYDFTMNIIKVLQIHGTLHVYYKYRILSTAGAACLLAQWFKFLQGGHLKKKLIILGSHVNLAENGYQEMFYKIKAVSIIWTIPLVYKYIG